MKDLAQTGTSFAAPDTSVTSGVTKNRGSKQNLTHQSGMNLNEITQRSQASMSKTSNFMAKDAKPGLNRPLGANDSVFTRSGPIEADPDVRDIFLGNQKKLQQEFDNLQKLLDSNYQVQIEVEADNKPKSKTRRGRNPVAKLSKALQQYKTERIGTEDALIKCIKKVNLDKAILFKEK